MRGISLIITQSQTHFAEIIFLLYFYMTGTVWMTFWTYNLEITVDKVIYNSSAIKRNSKISNFIGFLSQHFKSDKFIQFHGSSMECFLSSYSNIYNQNKSSWSCKILLINYLGELQILQKCFCFYNLFLTFPLKHKACKRFPYPILKAEVAWNLIGQKSVSLS